MFAGKVGQCGKGGSAVAEHLVEGAGELRGGVISGRVDEEPRDDALLEPSGDPVGPALQRCVVSRVLQFSDKAHHCKIGGHGVPEGHPRFFVLGFLCVRVACGAGKLRGGV